MAEIAPRAELMRSLGRLVRGLSALFWGLPLALVICVYVATSEWVKPMYSVGPVLVTGLLFYGLQLLGSFQRQERIWRDSLERTKIISVVNIGLAPFLYWHNRVPEVHFYEIAIYLNMAMGLLFLFTLNHLLQRLAAMLPDETLRLETQVFGNLNISLLSAIIFLFIFLYVVEQIPTLPVFIQQGIQVLKLFKYWIVVFLFLLPLAMTMTLIWKIKEVIFASVFSHEG
jgi:hypothetical protein